MERRRPKHTPAVDAAGRRSCDRRASRPEGSFDRWVAKPFTLMKNAPKCSKCQTEMETGYIMDRGHHNTRSQSTWVEGEPEPSFWTGTKIAGKEQFQVHTFRCPNCGYLESYAR